MSQPQDYYQQIQAIIDRNVKDLTWDKICTELNDLNSPFPDRELSSDECGVFYIRNSMENRAWRTSLGLMSWILFKLKEKADNGHCHNTDGHPHGNIEPRHCNVGREFHTRTYNLCLKSFKDAIETFHEIPAEQESPNVS
jgi:hypothetical protein